MALGKILTRYVVIELLKVFFVTLTAMTLMMLIVGVVREAMDEGLGIKQIVLLIPYILPDALRFTMPATLLFAASCVYGRMAAQNEVVALKSLGITPWVILVPGFVLAAAMSFVTVWLNDVAVSWGRNGVARVVLQAIDEIAYSRLATLRSFSNDKISINVKRVEGRRMIQPVFTIRSKSRSITVRCEHAELEADGNILKLICYNGAVEIDGGISYQFPDKYEMKEFELSEIHGPGSGEVTPSSKPLNVIYREQIEQEKKIQTERQELAVKAASQIVRGDLVALTGAEWNTEHHKLKDMTYILHRLRTEPPRRWSNGFSCLFFVVLASGVSIWKRNANMLSSFFLCFLPILLGFYPLLAMSVDMAKDGTMPPESVWLGNVVLLIASAFFLRQVQRY